MGWPGELESPKMRATTACLDHFGIGHTWLPERDSNPQSFGLTIRHFTVKLSGNKLVGERGFEPPASWSQATSSTAGLLPVILSGAYGRIRTAIFLFTKQGLYQLSLRRHKFGALGRNRTHDLLITGQLLFRLSYEGIYWCSQRGTISQFLA